MIFNFLDDLVRMMSGEGSEVSREAIRVEVIEDLSPREENPVSEVEDWTNGRPTPLPPQSYSPITRILNLDK